MKQHYFDSGGNDCEVIAVLTAISQVSARMARNMTKPAHLAVEYIFTYRLWQDILDEIQIWTAAKNYSWEWMLTFEVKSNLNISDGGIFYCTDGNGNAKVIWNQNKAYARRNT